MRVLHLPYNVASQIDTMVCALRGIGVDARGLVLNNSANQSCGEWSTTLRSHSWRRRPLRRIVENVRWWRAVMKALRWADVLHYRYGTRGPAALPWDMDLRYLARRNKACLIDFCGTDIRIPEIAAADNPYFARAYERGEVKPGSSKRSEANQKTFARYGFRCIVRKPELVPYLREDLFPSHFTIASPILLSAFVAKYPDPANDRPLVVHCPTHQGTKGSAAVLAAVETLKGECSFEFRLLEGMKRHEALAVVRECDVVVDQLVLGDYGNTTLEAMALGKPSVCYLKPWVVSQCAPGCPIVNANQDNLVQVLRRLLCDGELRRDIGRRSRQYVEERHDADKVARILAGIYRQVLEEMGAESGAEEGEERGEERTGEERAGDGARKHPEAASRLASRT